MTLIKQSPIIDLRSPSDYIAGHIMGAVHLPLDQLDGLWHELPSKGSKVQLCLYEDDRETVMAMMADRQFDVETVILHSQLGQFSLEIGSTNNRVWKGNPLLEKYTHLLSPELGTSPVAIDIGCGSGRDVILMGLLGYKVIALDVFDEALARVERSARRWALDVITLQLDCRQQPEAMIELFEEHSPQLIMQSRFLHRPLFDLYENYLPSGCKLAIHTFLEGAAKYGKPKKADFLLKNEELPERFSDWKVLLNQEHRLGDGRPLSMFIAQNTQDE